MPVRNGDYLPTRFEVQADATVNIFFPQQKLIRMRKVL